MTSRTHQSHGGFTFQLCTCWLKALYITFWISWVCQHCLFASNPWTMPCLLTCTLWVMSYLCNCVFRTVSGIVRVFWGRCLIVFRASGGWCLVVLPVCGWWLAGMLWKVEVVAPGCLANFWFHRLGYVIVMPEPRWGCQCSLRDQQVKFM